MVRKLKIPIDIGFIPEWTLQGIRLINFLVDSFTH